MRKSVTRTVSATAMSLLLSSSLAVPQCTEEVIAQSPGDAKPIPGHKAFPVAVGHGAGAQGGQGGEIIYVTNRDNSGPGSLRNCLVATGKRVCVFRIGGVFRFTTEPPIIKNPYLTIAGQTAPGGGVLITHSGGVFAHTPIVIKNTHDVIVRHVRVRLDRLSANRESDDAFTIENSTDVILDHVSGSWASDELVNGYGDNDRITISNSIFAYGIPRHDKCALLGSDPIDRQNVSFVGNLCAHNGDRNPDINFPPGSCIEVVNNVLYNAQSEFAEVWESYGGTPVAIAGNTFVKGPDSSVRSQGVTRIRTGSRGKARIYLWDNQFVGTFNHVTKSAKAVLIEKPDCPMTVTPVAAEKAYESVLETAGAWPRDAIDERVVRDVRDRSGRIVNEPGSLPAIAAGKAYDDADEDGMDDNWEIAHGADPRVTDMWEDADANGISNFEEFLSFREVALRGGAGA
ncbi:MAG: pectate lyase [Erythrobacter sp.]|uniref:pectate lyase family protein n=1 Tax=Erythrobacter sp. TaxID=1042 RepID=UPI002616B307|nr:pectate lyase [Erythrobacter sp.]MDJ0978687.1 pectate lyase [Erythrobacter sp.]